MVQMAAINGVTKYVGDMVWTNTVQKATIHQVTSMLATSNNVLFPGDNQSVGSSVPVVSRWLWHF